MLQRKRKFNWISSSNPENATLLNDLNNLMIEFYSKPKSRDTYQEMIDTNEEQLDSPSIPTTCFINYLKTIRKDTVLEVGCGSGRLYMEISNNFSGVDYTGIELSEKVIEDNRSKYPDANWKVAGAYDIPASSESKDVCFSFYVLEHLVYPEDALIEMLRIVKKGGYLIMVFPDFVSSKRFASQWLGISSNARAKEKFKKGKLLDVLISLYDSKIRLPKALDNAVKSVGNFPVNRTPICLFPDVEVMSPDIDAVYIASKQEIKYWALKNGHEVVSPAGESGLFSEHAFLAIKKCH